MSAQFTPGPWEVRGENLDCEIEVVSPNGETVCVILPESEETMAPSWEDARLIAAAPDGYVANCEAADFLRAYFGPVASDDPGGWSDRDARAVYGKLSAAIAKATGGANLEDVREYFTDQPTPKGNEEMHLQGVVEDCINTLESIR